LNDHFLKQHETEELELVAELREEFLYEAPEG